MKLVKGIKFWIEGYNTVSAAVNEVQIAYDFYKEEAMTEAEVDEAYNHAISFARHRRQLLYVIDENRLRNVSDDEVEQMEATADNEQQIEALARAINRLDAEERALITLFYYKEYSVAECAEIMGQSLSNTKVRLHRIRKKLYILITEKRYEKEL